MNLARFVTPWRQFCNTFAPVLQHLLRQFCNTLCASFATPFAPVLQHLLRQFCNTFWCLFCNINGPCVAPTWHLLCNTLGLRFACCQTPQCPHCSTLAPTLQHPGVCRAMLLETPLRQLCNTVSFVSPWSRLCNKHPVTSFSNLSHPGARTDQQR